MNNGKLLVVDDQLPHRQIVGEIVKRMDFTPIYADRCSLALDILDVNLDICGMITDMMMSDMNGDELIRRVRALEEWKDLPIIMVSAYLGPKDVHRILSEGCDAFLTKPISKNKLKDMVQSLFLHYSAT